MQIAPLMRILRSNVIVCDRAVRPARFSNVLASMVSLKLEWMSPPTAVGHADHLADIAIDAIPKKRGPKTDVLEALLKRVDGLEKRLQDEKNPISPTSPDPPEDLPPSNQTRRNTIDASFNPYSGDRRPSLSTSFSQPAESFARPTGQTSSPVLSQPQDQGHPSHSQSHAQSQSQSQNSILSDVLLDAYFGRLHGKPFYVLDETSTRQLQQLKQLSAPLAMAISAMTLR